MRKTRIIISLMIMAAVMLWYGRDRMPLTGSAIASPPGAQIAMPSESEPAPVVLFCPRDHCMENLVYLINRSEKAHCAFYDLDLPEVIDALKRKGAEVVVDGDNYDGNLSFARHDDENGLMHNKFCVFDEKTVLTGSFNPTKNDNYKNNNNVIIVFSATLAQNYEAEFQELWGGRFRKGEKVRNPLVIINGTLMENYFCPEDSCEDHVIRAIASANESVDFMTFSFTSDAIGNALKDRHWANVTVRGVFEKSQDNDFNEMPKLEDLGMDVRWDSNKYKMHHKVFIIDRRIVITGSYNPTKNGDENNDENVLIIHDPRMAGMYEEEFSRVANSSVA